VPGRGPAAERRLERLEDLRLRVLTTTLLAQACSRTRFGR
jgi:hypothetical protein